MPAMGRSDDVDHKGPSPQAALEVVGGTSAEHPSALPRLDTPSAETSWRGAGAFVWHETDVSPESLGFQLRENGFSWVAVRIHDGLAADPVEGDWVRRFRAASGLRVGGWGVLRAEPEREADLAHRLLDHYSRWISTSPILRRSTSSAATTVRAESASDARGGMSGRFASSSLIYPPRSPLIVGPTRKTSTGESGTIRDSSSCPRHMSTTSGARLHRRRVRREPPNSSPPMLCTRRSGCTRARKEERVPSVTHRSSMRQAPSDSPSTSPKRECTPSNGAHSVRRSRS